MTLPWGMLLALRRLCGRMGWPLPGEERVYETVTDRMYRLDDAAAFALVCAAYPPSLWTPDRNTNVTWIMSLMLRNGHVGAYQQLVCHFSIDGCTMEEVQNRALRDAYCGFTRPKHRLALFLQCTEPDPALWINALRLRPISWCREELQALAVATWRGRILDPLTNMPSFDLLGPNRDADAPAARQWLAQRFGVTVWDIVRAMSRTYHCDTDKDYIPHALVRAWIEMPVFTQESPHGTSVRVNGAGIVDTTAVDAGSFPLVRVDGEAHAVICILKTLRQRDTVCSVRLSSAPTMEELDQIAALAPRLAELHAQNASDAVLRHAAPLLMREPNGLRSLTLSASDITEDTLALYAGLHAIVLHDCAVDVTEGVRALLGPLHHLELVRTPCKVSSLTPMTDEAQDNLRLIRVVGATVKEGHAALRILGFSNPPRSISRSVSVEDTPFVDGFHNAHFTSASNLDRMSLRGCNLLNAEGFYSFANGAQGIQDLDVSNTSLCDMGLYYLQHYQSHQALNIAYTQVTADGLCHLGRRRDAAELHQWEQPVDPEYHKSADSRYKLRVLVLDGLSSVTAPVVRTILDNNPHVLLLSVCDCVNFDAGRFCHDEYPLLLLRKSPSASGGVW